MGLPNNAPPPRPSYVRYCRKDILLIPKYCSAIPPFILATAGDGGRNPVIRPSSDPLHPASSLVALAGNLAPGGAVIKASASKDRRLLKHAGPAVVFKNTEDLAARIDDPDLDVTPDSVLVLQGIGPIGFPGMPEVSCL